MNMIMYYALEEIEWSSITAPTVLFRYLMAIGTLEIVLVISCKNTISVICVITYQPLDPRKCVKHQDQLSDHQNFGVERRQKTSLCLVLILGGSP